MNEVYKNSGFVVLATIFFVVNDAVINHLTLQEVKFYHFMFYGTLPFLGVPALLIIRGNLKAKLSSTNYMVPILRGLIFIPMPYIAFISLKNISLPEFTTLNMASPIFATILSLIFLREKINFPLVISLIFGVLGVLFVVQPGFEKFNIYFLLVLLGSFFLALTTLIVNKFNNTISTEGYFIFGGLPIHLLSFCLFLLDPLFLDGFTLVLVLLSSVLVNSAIFLIAYSFQRAQKFYGSISCLIYLQILWSVLIGFIAFDEYLNHFALIGSFFIFISGFLSMIAQRMQLKNSN